MVSFKEKFSWFWLRCWMWVVVFSADVIKFSANRMIVFCAWMVKSAMTTVVRAQEQYKLEKHKADNELQYVVDQCDEEFDVPLKYIGDIIPVKRTNEPPGYKNARQLAIEE